MNRRSEQINSVLHRAIQSVLNEGFADPRLERAMITVTQVRVTDDKRTAVVSVSALPEEKQKLTLHGLKDAARHIRRKAADKVAVHRMPELVFKLDKSLKRQAAVLSAIAEAREASGISDEEELLHQTETPGEDSAQTKSETKSESTSPDSDRGETGDETTGARPTPPPSSMRCSSARRPSPPIHPHRAMIPVPNLWIPS